MRKIIAALHMSLDGFIEGPSGELDWVETWEGDAFNILHRIDTCILGGGMYPGYEQYWQAILASPEETLALTGRTASKGEIDYASFAARTPHVVLSRTMSGAAWKNTRIVGDIEEIRRLKRQSGKDMHAVGGAMLVSSLMDHDLIDELRLVVHPLVLGGGKALFQGVNERHALRLLEARPLESGLVCLTYAVQPVTAGTA